MRPDKGHGVLFEALPAILEHCPKTRLVLVGAGPYATAVREKAKSFGDTVDILGERHDVPRLLGASDLFVSPSRNEGLPTVIIEAGAAGLPTVATDVGGTREIVKDQITGILVSPDRPDQLAGAVIRTLARSPPHEGDGIRGSRAHSVAIYFGVTSDQYRRSIP